MSIFCKFDRARIILLLIMSLSTTYSFAQLPFNNPVFDTVFVETFDARPYANSTKWYPYYPWGLGNFFSCDTVSAGTGVCPRVQYLAHVDSNRFDTTNRVIRSGVCTLIAKDSLVYGPRRDYFPYPSTECTSLGLGPSWDPYRCMHDYTVQYKYSSGALFSRQQFKYGYFEMRFRLRDWAVSSHNGYSLNFWMFNQSSSVRHSELDIFEIDCTNGKYTNNVHVDAAYDGNDSITYDGYHYWEAPPHPLAEPFVGLSQTTGIGGWHTATCFWSPDSITFSYDGLEHRVAENPDTNKYLIPMPMIIDLGLEATNFCSDIDSLTNFPILWDIDYIKVWQPKLACTTPQSYCNVTASTFDSKLYENLTIGGSGCTANFNNGNVSALGTEYVELKEGVEIGNNMEMLIDVWPCWDGQLIQMPTEPYNPPPPDFLKRKQHPSE
ncbi:MAG TPA: family 16 glycosylhydrolase [Bacteroidia bacterium]